VQLKLPVVLITGDGRDTDGHVAADLVGVAKACGISDSRTITTMAEVEAFAPCLQDVSSGPRFAGVKIDSANLERVLSSSDGYLYRESHPRVAGIPADLAPNLLGAMQ